MPDSVKAVLIIGVLLLFFLSLNFKIIPKNKHAIVERFGQFHRIIKSGFYFLTPFFDRICYVASIEPNFRKLNVSATSPGDGRFQVQIKYQTIICDIRAFYYESKQNFSEIDVKIKDIVKEKIGNMQRELVKTSLDDIKDAIVENLQVIAVDIGVEITVTSVII
ncbi:MAG: hypothetical protein IH571_07155 [Acholeplasmataceae bacterium]|nr:hypothetical protein [Acholeplasmataceae bacterium]